MSVGAILGSVLQSALAATNTPSKFKQFQQEFQQLGKDLQSGNVAQAESDLVTLEQNSPYLRAGASTSGTTSGSATTSNNPISQAFNQLAQDLKTGNLTAAQQDFSTIQQDFQNARSQAQTQSTGHHHHHAFSSQNSTSPLAQLFSQLGQALQNGNLSSAQHAYSTIQQDFQQFASAGGSGGGSVNTTA